MDEVTEAQRINRAFLVAPVLWLAALRLLEISWFGSVVTALTVGVLGMFGCELAERAVRVKFGLAVGVVIGFGVLVFAGQVLRFAGLNRHLSYLLPLGAMTLLLGTSFISRTQKTVQRDSQYEQEMLFVLAVGLVAISLAHPWLAPFALAVSVSDLLSRRSRVSLLVLATLSIGVALSWVMSQQLRPDKWWYFYQSNDAQFFEAISWSSARWTIFEHPGLVGGSITNYHWFAYTAFGALSSIAALGPWDALMKVGVLLLPALFASLFVRTSVGFPVPFTIRWVAVVLGTVAMEAIRSDSLVFSMVVAFAFLIVVLETTSHSVTWGATVLFLLLSAVLVFSKVSTAAVVGLLLALFALLSAKRGIRVPWVPVVTLFVVSLVAFLLFFRGNDPQQVATLTFNLDSSMNEFFDLLESRLLINVLIVGIVPLVWFGGRSLRDIDPLSSAVVIIAILTLAVHLVLAGTSTRYFALPGVWFVTLFAVRKLSAGHPSRSPHPTNMFRRLLVVCLMLSLAAGYVLPKILRRLDSRLIFEGNITSFVWSVITSAGPMFGVLLIIPVSYLLARHRNIAAFLLVTTLGVFAGQSAEQFMKLRYWGPEIYESDNPVAAVFGNDDMAALGKYVRQHTNENAILASNHFCCFGESWQISGHSDSEFRYVSVGSAPTLSSKGGGNYLLPAYTERRFLVQGLRFQQYSGSDALAGDPFRRLRVSLEFANRPSQRAADNLKAYDVSGFIVNLALTDQRNWSKFADERFRSGEFVYLELR